MEEIIFTVDGQKIHGTLIYPAKPQAKNPALLFLHGWMSNSKRNIFYAQHLAQLGFISLAIDIRSHGESEGQRSELSRKDYVKDVVAAYDVLSKLPEVDKAKIGVIGSSFGSYLGALLTIERKVTWLVLRAPANYPDTGFNQPHVRQVGDKIVHWRKQTLPANGTRSLQAIHHYTGEIMIVESELDDICPHQTISNYSNAVQDKKMLTHKIIKGADHSLKEEKHRTVFYQYLLEWFGGRA